MLFILLITTNYNTKFTDGLNFDGLVPYSGQRNLFSMNLRNSSGKKLIIDYDKR